MYILPQYYRCNRCGQEELYSPHHGRTAPTFASGPICSACFERFLAEYCGTLEMVPFEQQKVTTGEKDAST